MDVDIDRCKVETRKFNECFKFEVKRVLSTK